MCDTLVIVQPERVLFAKNSDRDPNEAQLLDWQPCRRHPAGARVQCTWIEIPQVDHTHAVLLSRPFWMWGAEIGTNECGVTIGNEAVFTHEPYAKSGLTGMDLVRLALERADRAERAVETITRLIEVHGQGGGCGHEKRSFTYHNSFLVADARQAFVVETAGRQYAVEEIRGARTISNGLSISGFAEKYGDAFRTRVAGCRWRQARTQHLAGQATSLGDLMDILRDHGGNAPRGVVPCYSSVNGGLNAPCVHAGGLVAASQTTASWVAELRPDGCAHWVTATAAPCISLFKPVRIDDPLDLGAEPNDHFDDHSLWWRHEILHRAVMHDPARLAALFLSERDDVERAWLANPPDPHAAFDLANQLLSQWTARVLDQLGADTRPWFVRRYWERRNRRARLPRHSATLH
jgi:dipeptidase